MPLGVAVLIIGLICLLIVSQRFRRVAAVALGILLVGVLLLVGWYEENQHKRDAAKTYIKTNEIDLVDPRVSFSSYNGRPDRMSGRIRNNSGYALDSVEVRLVFQDCSPKNECETVDEQKVEIHANIPSGQSRDFDEYLFGSAISPRGRIAWSYQTISVSAHVD